MIRVLEAPRPILRTSLETMFPCLVEVEDGTLLACFTMGTEMDSADSLTHLCRSSDGGRTWSQPQPIFPEFRKISRSETSKITALGGRRIAALGYAFDRTDPERPLANPQTGGMQEDIVIWAVSEDAGCTWSAPREIRCKWGAHVEASAPLTVLRDGSWISPVAGFPDWDGKMLSRACGRVIRSFDQGNTWNDDVVCMAFPDAQISCYEQRLCQLDSGAIVVIGWNEDLRGGNLLRNHFTASFDNGASFTPPKPTGIAGQAASLCALGGERLLALHAVRRDTNRPGVYACEIDFSGGVWHEIDRKIVWEPSAPLTRSADAAEIFAYLKFGQPSALRLRSGEIIMAFWAEEAGQKRCLTMRLAVD